MSSRLAARERPPPCTACHNSQTAANTPEQHPHRLRTPPSHMARIALTTRSAVAFHPRLRVNRTIGQASGQFCWFCCVEFTIGQPVWAYHLPGEQRFLRCKVLVKFYYICICVAVRLSYHVLLNFSTCVFGVSRTTENVRTLQQRMYEPYNREDTNERFHSQKIDLLFSSSHSKLSLKVQHQCFY